MEQTGYERPREKVRNRGVGSLNMTELLQLLIGSGTARAPVPRLARQVEVLLRQDLVTYETLVALPGIGEAKACQLLATVEVARRLYTHG